MRRWTFSSACCASGQVREIRRHHSFRAFITLRHVATIPLTFASGDRISMYDAHRHEFHFRQESSSSLLPPPGNSDAEVTLRRKTEICTRRDSICVRVSTRAMVFCLPVVPHNVCQSQSHVVRQARNAAYRIGTLWLETQFDEARACAVDGFGDCGLLAVTLWVLLFTRSLNLRGRMYWNLSKRGGRRTKKRSREKKTQLSAKSRYGVHCHETLVFGVHYSVQHVHQR